MNRVELWRRYLDRLCEVPEVGLTVDLSRMNYPPDYPERMEPAIQRAYGEMAALEAGAIANPDENRMVGHYWLRAPELAPSPEITDEIEGTLREILAFTARIHSGETAPPAASRFTRLLVVGIGGSALGPQFVADALGSRSDRMTPHFFDNTDPDGFDRVLDEIGPHLPETLVLVISKSGGTKETRNGMVEAAEAFSRAGLAFAKQAVAVTGRESELDRTAVRDGWLARFPMWDWVGGRTSVTSAVGLLPAALQGIDVKSLLDGARRCDAATRSTVTSRNPAALLALMWYYATDGRGARDMVILPYKDRLLLFSRYLQQLIMESLGKELDRDGKPVFQGISVYGNKGSTDQHAYVQQLREGVPNFFATFIQVLEDRQGSSLEVEPGITSGDYLSGFFQGTRQALYEKGRESVTITAERVDARTIGALIALYERTVGLYASLVNINAYHQPGVEAGKKAAESVLRLQRELMETMRNHPGREFTAEELAALMDRQEETETVFHILQHLAADRTRNVETVRRTPVTASSFSCR